MVRGHRRDRVVRQHGPALRPPARLRSRPAWTTSCASCIPTIATRWAATSRPRSSTARRTRWTCVSCCPTKASAGCTPAPAPCGPDGPPERITGLLSDVTERRQREEAHAFLDAASQVLARLDGPGRDARGGRAAGRAGLADWCAVQLVRRPAYKRSPSPTSTRRRSAGRTSCRSATRRTPTPRPARPP